MPTDREFLRWRRMHFRGMKAFLIPASDAEEKLEISSSGESGQKAEFYNLLPLLESYERRSI